MEQIINFDGVRNVNLEFYPGYTGGSLMEKIVRCKDCCWYEPVQEWCCQDKFGGHEAQPGGFCAWGK